MYSKEAFSRRLRRRRVGSCRPWPAQSRTGSFFFSSRRRHTRFYRDWSSDVCSSDLHADGRPGDVPRGPAEAEPEPGGQQQGVVRPRRDRDDEREADQPEQLGHLAGGAVGCAMPAVDPGRHGAVLYDPCMSTPGRLPVGREWVRAWKPVVGGVDEVFHARFVDYAYPPHVHDTWTVFVVDDGWIRYDLDTRQRGAGGGRVTLLPPHVVHDGRPASGAGFRKRVLYLATDVLDERLTGRAVDEPDIREPGVLHAVHALHRALREPDDALEADARLATVGERPGATRPRAPGEPLVPPLLDAPTPNAAAATPGTSPTPPLSSFLSTFGI